MTQRQRVKTEAFWDYGKAYWACHAGSTPPPEAPAASTVLCSEPTNKPGGMPVTGCRVSIWFRGDKGAPWYGGEVLKAVDQAKHLVKFDDGELLEFDLEEEERLGQLLWEEPTSTSLRLRVAAIVSTVSVANCATCSACGSAPSHQACRHQRESVQVGQEGHPTSQGWR